MSINGRFNAVYTLLCPVFCALKSSQLKNIYRKAYFYLVVNTESC